MCDDDDVCELKESLVVWGGGVEGQMEKVEYKMKHKYGKSCEMCAWVQIFCTLLYISASTTH